MKLDKEQWTTDTVKRLFLRTAFEQLAYGFLNDWQTVLWSQIKLTSYDFSNLLITGIFDNRPAHGI